MFMFATGFPKRRDMLKPAYEPIVLAYKPGGKRTLQVDECRIGTEARINPPATNTSNRVALHNGWRDDAEPTIAVGRWPANIITDGSDEVVALFPESGGQQGDVRGTEPSRPALNVYGEFGRKPFARRGDEPTNFQMQPGIKHADHGGSAARFFFSAKAGAQDRWGSKHPTVKPVELMKWLVALVTPPGGTCLDPFAGSGTTAVAALATGRNAILIEREDQYVADIRARLAFYEGGGMHSVQAKNRNRKVDHGPLFGGDAA
jgi:site-specific DNA-methyltransferase (adenine-specific)